MQQAVRKWGRKRSHQLSIFAALITLILLSSLFSSTHNPPSTSPPKFSTFHTASTHASASAAAAAINGSSDWAKACAAPRKHSGDPTERIRRRGGGERKEGCDVFSGRWVYDKESRPLYEEASCPWMSDQLACTKHGRLDTHYQRWRWQPHACHLKRWNATEMLEKLRGKRLMFIGDSLNRGQWISMVCLVQSVIPTGRKSMSPNAVLTIFRAEDYNATIEFYWAPLIVESNSDDPVNHKLDDRIIRPDSLLKHASHWEKADILIFNTYLWWRSGLMIKLLWTREEFICEEADGILAMKLALETWAYWVSSSVNSHREIFFVTMSPTHLWSYEWNPGSKGNCFEESTPIDTDGYWGSGSDLKTMRIVDDIMSLLESKVRVVNITQLSEYRKDGHPSIYRKFWEAFSSQQLSNPASYADCIHWCLPGVPDVWNELIYNLL